MIITTKEQIYNLEKLRDEKLEELDIIENSLSIYELFDEYPQDYEEFILLVEALEKDLEDIEYELEQLTL